MLPLLTLFNEVLNFTGSAAVIWGMWLVLDLCWRRILFRKEQNIGNQYELLGVKVVGALLSPVIM